MRKFYTLIFLCLLLDVANAQTITVTGSGTASSYIYGPFYTFGTTAARYYRAAYIYPASLMSAMPSGANIQSIGFERTGTQALTGGVNYKIYLQNTALSDWGTGSLAWDVSGATLVYDSDPTSIVSNSAGWKTFSLIAPFNYGGGNLAILIEYSQPAGTGTATTLNWVYQTSTTQPAYVNNQTKYLSSTTAVPASLTSSTANHPNLEITYTTVACSGTPTAGTAVSNATGGVCAGAAVSLSLTGNSNTGGIIYKWQSSSTEFGSYSDVSGELSTPGFVVNPSSTTWYRAVVKCGAAGTPQNSVAVEVVTNPALPAGVYTINNLLPTGGTNFQSFTDAVNRMNCGVAGNVIFEVSAGQTFTAALDIIFQGTASSTVTFRKTGAGANPKISRTGTSATGEYILKLTGADYLTFDGIDFEQTGTSTTDWIEYGVFISNASATNGSQNNTFKNGTISLSNANSACRGVFMDQVTTSTSMAGTNSNNKFLNMTVQNSFNAYYFTGSTASFLDDNNEINTEAGGVSTIRALGNGTVNATLYAIYSTYQTNFKVKNTQINNIANGGTSTTYVFYTATGAANSAEISGNTISNITGGGTLTGIYMTAGSSLNIFNNKFFSIRSTTAAASAVRVIDLSDASLSSNIYTNQIYDISSTGITGTTVGAIEVATGLVYNIYNNMISDLRAPASTSTAGSIKGIAVVGGSTGGVVRIYYNTVLLNDVGTAANYTAAGIYNSSTIPTLDIRNNIIVNRSDVSAGTRAVALWKTSATINIDANSDNNLYYAGTPGPKNLIYYDGTNSAQALDDYKALPGISPREINSVTENVVFLPITAGVIRLDPNSQSVAESGGQEIAGYTVDFEGTQRGPYPLAGQVNGAGLKPDIGADEYDGRRMDVLGPAIDFTPLDNTSSTANRTFIVTITDPSGVRTGADGPRLYYRKSGSSVYAFDNNPSISGDQFTFTFNYAAIGGVVAGDVIEYYVAAQDMNNYSSTRPFGGSGSNPPGTTAPVTPRVYRILYTLNGNLTVGASGNYPNLTAIANFLNNSAEVTGHTVFELQADYDGTTGETFPIQFNQYLTSNPNWTVTIRPAPGVTARTTSGDPGTSNPLINLNGVDRLIFDGRPGGTGTGNEWTFRNTRTAATIASVFRLIDDATNDTLRYLTLEGQPTATTQGLVFFSTSTGTLGNSFNAVTNNIIRGRTDGTPTTISIGIYASGTETALNSDNTISGNHIVNSVSNGINIAATGNGPNWLINANHIFADQPSTVSQTGITIAADNTTNTTISNNYIGGNSANATGTMTNSGNVAVSGISITNGVVNITNNTIANISTTNTGTTVRNRGINFTSDLGNSLIQGNTIFNLSSMGAVTGYAGGSVGATGIYYFPGGYHPVTIRQNTVYNISIDNTSALTATNIAAGMVLTNMGGVAAENRVYNIKNKTTGTTAGQPPVAAGMYLRFLTGAAVNNMVSIGTGENDDVQYTGILVAGGAIDNSATINIHHNSIFVSGASSGGNSSYAFLRGDNSTTTQLQTINLRNNILMNTRTGTAVNYAIGNQGTAAATYWTSNYNVLHNSNASTTGFWNATGYDFAGWQTASSNDPNSQTLAVSFADAATADLHLAGASVGNQLLAGTPIAGITTDFDLQARSTTRPYMGADEAAIGLPVKLEYFKGVRQNNVHVLNWKGQCTGNDNGFTVERSANGRDFTSIGEVKASRTDCDFAFGLTDRSPLPGTNYYRLKIKDENGRISYSIIIAILNKENGFEIVSVFPTLAKTNLFVNVTSSKNLNLNLSVTDGQGRVIQKTAKAVQQGSSLISLDVSSLAAGTYILQCITADGYEKTVRFVKQ